jgi:hypothetical protein
MAVLQGSELHLCTHSPAYNSYPNNRTSDRPTYYSCANIYALNPGTLTGDSEPYNTVPDTLSYNPYSN